jgi:hypothetical protein
MTEPWRYAGRPCAECPWRRDTPPGKFPAERYERLRDTSPGPRGESASLGAPIFACHMSHEGGEFPCAGWLATQAHAHVGIRYAVLRGALPKEVLRPGEDWPDLFTDYDEMAARQGRRGGDAHDGS